MERLRRKKAKIKESVCLLILIQVNSIIGIPSSVNNKTLLFLDDSPAFVCEKVSVELGIDRMTDMAVNEMMKTKNVLYISRGQLKSHTSTIINFTIGKCVLRRKAVLHQYIELFTGVRYLHQRVNMPLLRLLHQISNMYQNVKDTQNELREEQPVEIRRPKTSNSDHGDLKNHSSSKRTR